MKFETIRTPEMPAARSLNKFYTKTQFHFATGGKKKKQKIKKTYNSSE